MEINGIKFLTSIGKPFHYRDAVYVPMKKHSDYYEALDKMLEQYNKAGYNMRVINCNDKFCSMMDPVSNELNVKMNYTNAQVHECTAE